MKNPENALIAGPTGEEASDGPAFERIERTNSLEPGQYWRLTKTVQVPHPQYSDKYHIILHEGDLHLITSLFEFEGTLHSITILEHPRNVGPSGKFSSYTLLTTDFLTAFEPLPLDEAKAVRAAEQNAVMQKVKEVQDEMAQAQMNPLALPAIQEAAQRAVEDFERKEAHKAQAEIDDTQKRAADLRRIHRRAARRSEAKGNPIAVRKAAISDRLDVMISEGVTSDGVRDLQLEAGRRLAIAQATSDWLVKRSREVAEILKGVAPYLSEQGQLALASASSAIGRVTEIERGIKSLKLYTGDGVDVVTVREGTEAPSHEPLTLMQRKLAMDEELAVWVDVESTFDYTSAERFFQHLATDERLLQQILPTPRCVVSMQVTRRSVDYGDRLDPFERLQREIANRKVFLLVRNGQNVSVVYSCEPSHEAAHRLFPTAADIHKPFEGLDGANIGLQDVAFGKASKRFEDQALHYRRFLILLCGLDHRLNLFGEFFPAQEKPAFMSLAFQQRYFRFVEDDDQERMIGGQSEGVYAWMARHNANLRSGSRVVVTSRRSLTAAIPSVSRSHCIEISNEIARAPLIAAGSSEALYLKVPTISSRSGKAGNATAWLTGPNSNSMRGVNWFLCLDQVKATDVHRFIHNRNDRIGDIGWLLTLRRALAILQRDELAQAELRAYLTKAALDAKVQREDTVDEAIHQAISTWRADHRGADAPAVTDKTGVSQLLSLLFPANTLSQSMRPPIEELCAHKSLSPLMLTRTGKNQYALYSIYPEDDRARYSHGVAWGWVRRNLIKFARGKATLGSESAVWLQSKTMESTEEIVIRWDGLDQWVHEEPEPCKLYTLAKAKVAITRGQQIIEMIAQARDSGLGIEPREFEAWYLQLRELGKKLVYTQKPTLWTLLGVYQVKKNAKPVFVYGSTSFLNVLTFASEEQRNLFSQLKGYRSEMITNDMGERKRPQWNLRISPELHLQEIELQGSTRESSRPTWAVVKTHERGGDKRKELNFGVTRTTRSDRRKANGLPKHTSCDALLSPCRAVETLMGLNPYLRRKFYKSVNDRVRERKWASQESVADQEAREKKCKEERGRRYEPQVPQAFELAGFLWNPVRGISDANRWLNAGYPGKY